MAFLGWWLTFTGQGPFRVEGLGFKVQGSGPRVSGLGRKGVLPGGRYMRVLYRNDRLVRV